MESIQTIQTEEAAWALFSEELRRFFDYQTPEKHLQFLAHSLLISKEEPLSFASSIGEDRLYFKKQLFSLIHTAIHYRSLVQSPPELSVLDRYFFVEEAQKLRFYPYFLPEEELAFPFSMLHPAEAFGTSFPLSASEESFEHHFSESMLHLNDTSFPLYFHLQQFIGACWLIHERYVSGRSFQRATYQEPQLQYALSCPHLLQNEELEYPFLLIEQFFSFASLQDYQNDIQQWFKLALIEEEMSSRPADLLFIYHQLELLLQAGYLIVKHQIPYLFSHPHSTRQKPLVEWLIQLKKYHPEEALNSFFSEIHFLENNYRQDPMAYCRLFFTEKELPSFRNGLNEWLIAAMSNSTSISSLPPAFLFEQFEKMQKMIEALYLLLVVSHLKHHPATSPKMSNSIL